MDIQALTTEEDWQGLSGHWDALVERSASATVFLTWEWLWHWWRSLRREGDELFVLAAWDDAAGDCRLPIGNCRLASPKSRRLVGLAPLYRSRARASHRLGTLRRIGFIGDSSGDSEYLDFAIEPGREEQVVAAFLDAIERDAAGWDLLCFHVVPASSPNLAVVRRLAAERGWLADEKSVPRLAIRLPTDWESYLRSLQPRFRSKLRSLGRRLPAEHQVAFELCRDPAELPERLESLFALHQRRWRAEGQPGTLEEYYAKFYGPAASPTPTAWLFKRFSWSNESFSLGIVSLLSLPKPVLIP